MDWKLLEWSRESSEEVAQTRDGSRNGEGGYVHRVRQALAQKQWVWYRTVKAANLSSTKAFS